MPCTLRTVCAAAEILHTTQPAVSKTIKAFESDLGAAVFVRSTTRITGFTTLGEGLTELAHSILRDSAAVVELARESTRATRGVLTIGTTHSCARYMLPYVVRAFTDRYPEVVLAMDQGAPRTIPEWVATGRVTLGITTMPQPAPGSVLALRARDSEHCIIAPRGHEVLAKSPPTLADIAIHPLVTYSSNLAASSDMQTVLRDHGYTPKIAVIARDASVVKAHVSCGVGIAVIQDIALEASDEQRFGRVDASHLLPPAAFHVLFRRDQHFRSYMYDFIEMFSPHWTREKIRDRLGENMNANAYSCGLRAISRTAGADRARSA